MKDLTEGSILRQLAAMSLPIAIGMLVQTLYVLVDLYFVGRLGDTALAGVSAAGNVMFISMALTQMLSVGALALIARAIGARDAAQADLVFNQSLAMSLLCALFMLAAAWWLSPPYLRLLGADAATAQAGVTYLRWYAPGLALQFALNAVGTALRAGGVVKPGMLVQLLSVLINALLAPILITGWLTGLPLGVAGAGLASSLAVLAALAMLGWYVMRHAHVVSFDAALMAPRPGVWRRLLGIGFPAGAEFACLFVFSALVYACISSFGATAMAGYGVGARILQAIFLPGMAIAFAVPAIAGQNLGAGAWHRVAETMRKALILEAAVMAALTVACKLQPAWLVTTFTTDAASAAVAAQFLQIISWNFVATGLAFVSSGLFQALGNTWPSLLSTLARLLVFGPAALWLSRQPGFTLPQLWRLSVATVALQAALSLVLLRRQWRNTLAAHQKRRDVPKNAPAAA